MDKQQPLRLWIFVIGLNVVAFLGYFWVRAHGIDQLALG
jgi:hypothetical protein